METKFITCECGFVLKITPKQQTEYEARGWSLPKRCKKCKVKRDKEFDEMQTYD